MHGTERTRATKKAAERAAKKKTSKKPAVGKRAKKTEGKRPAGRSAVVAAAPAGVPNIDYSLCQGCGGCAEAFPHLFEMRGERAWVIGPEGFDPVRDAGVLTICPYYAISIERI